MKFNSLIGAMVFAVGVAGCSENGDSKPKSSGIETEQINESLDTGKPVVEKFTEDAANIIESNVESIEANVEKSADDSPVSPEQFGESKVVPEEDAIVDPNLPSSDIVDPTKVRVSADHAIPPTEVVEEGEIQVETSPADK